MRAGKQFDAVLCFDSQCHRDRFRLVVLDAKDAGLSVRVAIDRLGGDHQGVRMRLKGNLCSQEHSQPQQARLVADANPHQPHVGGGIHGGRGRRHAAGKLLARKSLCQHAQGLAQADSLQIDRRHVPVELHFHRVCHFEDRLRAGAINLFSGAHQALDHSAAEGRLHFRSRKLQARQRYRGLRLFQRRLRHALLRSGIFHIFAGGDASFEQVPMAHAIRPRILECGLGLVHAGLGLLKLIPKGTVVDSRQDRALLHRVTFRHKHFGDAARHQ